MTSLNIAFLPIARTTFDLDFAREKTTAALAQLSEAPFNLLGSEELVTDSSGIQQAISLLQEKDVDLLVIFQATFADSSMVMELSQAIDAPLFLWAVTEPHTGGRLRLNSMCGINLAGHAYRAKTSSDRKRGKKGGKSTTVDLKNGFWKR
jgi:hypothetical protein